MIARWFWREWRSPSLLIVWPVSYTHLTLPTNREVELSVGTASIKKKKKSTDCT